MQNKGAKKRLNIFEEFSKNFAIVMKNPFLKKTYVCPLCRKWFEEKDLNQSFLNPLTLEDVPPKKLNGKPLVLTCKKCNNVNGSEYDSNLSKWFKAHTSLEGEGILEFRMSIGSSKKFKASLKRDKDKKEVYITTNKKKSLRGEECN